MNYNKSFPDFFRDTLFAQILLILIFVGAVFFFNWSFDKPAGQASIIVNLDNQQRVFKGPVIENMTVLDALSAALAAGHVQFEYALSDDGSVNIMQIGGQLNNIEGKSFQLYLNSKKIKTTDSNKEIINPGDEIELKFE